MRTAQTLATAWVVALALANVNFVCSPVTHAARKSPSVPKTRFVRAGVTIITGTVTRRFILLKPVSGPCRPLYLNSITDDTTEQRFRIRFRSDLGLSKLLLDGHRYTIVTKTRALETEFDDVSTIVEPAQLELFESTVLAVLEAQ